MGVFDRFWPAIDRVAFGCLKRVDINTDGYESTYTG